MSRRPGVTLIELVAVLGIGAVMMGVTVTLLYGLLRADCSGRDHLRQSIGLGRLADQFRRDVHAAKTSRDVTDGDGRQFELAADRTVTYRLQSGGLTRSEQVGEATVRRESFALPPGATASIQMAADAQPAIVSLMITPVAKAPEPAGGPVIRIDAVLARDHRFAKPEEP